MNWVRTKKGCLHARRTGYLQLFCFELLNFESGKTLDFYSFGALSCPPVNFCSYRISLFFWMDWVDTRNVCLLAEDHAVCFNCLSVINVGKSGLVKFGAGFARLFLGCIFPNFCRVIWFYADKIGSGIWFLLVLGSLYVFKADFVLESNWQTASAR